MIDKKSQEKIPFTDNDGNEKNALLSYEDRINKHVLSVSTNSETSRKTLKKSKAESQKLATTEAVKTLYNRNLKKASLDVANFEVNTNLLNIITLMLTSEQKTELAILGNELQKLST